MTRSALPGFVLFHVPHDSTWIPDEVRSQFLLDDAALALEIVKMTDHLTMELFTRDVPEMQLVRAEVSRLVVDVERFDDPSEVMLERGMGVIYSNTSDGSALRSEITPEQRNQLIANWYVPHHQRLTNLANAMIYQYGHALLIDVHSFPSRPLPYEPDQRKDRLDICLGTDEFHTPAALETSFRNAFVDQGFSVSTNFPFGGALVPMQHYGTDTRLSAIMIEVNRSLYLEEATGVKNSRFEDIRERIRNGILTAIQNCQHRSLVDP
jgi:N-formylglutamate deformylase